MLATNVHKSKQAVKRASALQMEMGRNPNIGGSSVEILSKMGSEQSLTDTIKLLEDDISNVEKAAAGGATLTKEQKEDIKSKKEELAHTKVWQEAHADLINNSDESYSPAAEKRAYKAYADLINLYNKRSKLTAVVSKTDVDNNFVKIIDYMRLNKDNKSYVDAMNLLADPNNINLVTSSIISAHRAMNEIFKNEHKAEVKAAGDTTGEVHDDDIKNEAKDAEAKKAKDAADLEKHLQEEYNKVKTASEASGINIVDYETWKKQAGVSVATRYAKAKEVKDLLSEISSIKLTQEDYDKVAAKFTAMESNLSETDKKTIKKALEDKQAEVTKELEKISTDNNELYKKLYRQLKAGKILTAFTKEEQGILNDIKYKDLRDAIDAEPETSDIEEIKKLIGEKDDDTLIDWESVTEFNKEGNAFKKGEKVTVDDILWNLKEGLKDAEAKLQTILGTEDRKYYTARKDKFTKLINQIEKEPVEVKIEPEDKAGEYRKAYKLVKDFMEGKDENSPENQELFTKYPNLIEEFKQVELKRQAELKTTKNPTAVKDKYDQLIRDVIAKGKPFVAEEEEEDLVPAHAQGLDRIKKAQMESDTLYADRDFQVGYRQVEPSNSLGNRTDNFEEPTTGTGTYKRTDINSNYVFDVATQEFPPGSKITYKVITDQAEYDKMGPNRLTGEKYNASIIFDKDGKVNEKAYDDTPIGVYATIRGEERLIGTVHEPLWIQIKKAGEYPHIAPPEGINIEEHVKKEVANNRKIRKTILDSFNKNSKFVISGTIESKSKGILKMVNDAGLLKDRVNSKIGEGNSNNKQNRHGYFAIMRTGSLQTDINVEAENVVETEAFTKNTEKYAGVPALMLPTPNGDYMPTFIGLPKIYKNQAEFILEAWKVFKGFTQNPELAEAVYKAVGRDLVGEPNINVLSEYLSQYYTALDHSKEKPLSPIGNGSEVVPGQAIFDIDAFGNIILQVKDIKTKEWFNNDGKPIRTEKDIPANMVDLLQNLRTTIKFNDRKNDNLHGINSTEKITFLSMENGKLISKDMTYNENLLDKATTLVEKGTQSETAQKDWVYFANPVLKMTLGEAKVEDVFDEEKEEVVPGDTFNSDIEDDFDALERIALSNLLTPDQVEEEATKCTPNPFADA